MILELQAASRIICQRLRQRPYQRGVTITAWSAILDQLMDGSRSGAFSWRKALETEVRGYIAEMDEATKRRIWEATEDADIIRNATIETITRCLYPFVCQATMPRILRAVQTRERIQGEPDGPAKARQPLRRVAKRRPSADGSQP